MLECGSEIFYFFLQGLGECIEMKYHLWSIHMESRNLQGMGECIDISLMVNSCGKSQFTGNGRMY